MGGRRSARHHPRRHGRDFPSIYGRIECGPTFAELERFFVPLAEDEYDPDDYEPDADERWLDNDALTAAGYPSRSWILVPDDDTPPHDGPTYLHALVAQREGCILAPVSERRPTRELR